MGQVCLSLFLSPQIWIKVSAVELKKKKEWKEVWTGVQIEKVRSRWKIKIEEPINRTTRGNKERNMRERREAITWEFLTNPALPLIAIFSTCSSCPCWPAAGSVHCFYTIKLPLLTDMRVNTDRRLESKSKEVTIERALRT